MGENGAEFVEGAGSAHAGGVGFDAKLPGDLGVGFVLVKAEEDERAIFFGELVDGSIDFRGEGFPRFFVVVHGIEREGNLFTFLASDLRANMIDRGAVGFAVEPGGERKACRDFGSLFDELEKDSLGNVAGGFVVPGDAAGDGVDERQVSIDEGAKVTA